LINSEDQLLVLKILLALGADIMAVSNTGWTVLHFAAESSALEIIKYLVEEKQIGKNNHVIHIDSVFFIVSLPTILLHFFYILILVVVT
jgi:ankyrin repeat protein